MMKNQRKQTKRKTIPNKPKPKTGLSKLNQLLNENERLLGLDATPRNVERSNKAFDRLASFVLRGANQRQFDEFYSVSATYTNPNELRAVSKRIYKQVNAKKKGCHSLRK